jgi:hypothetical protein
MKAGKVRQLELFCPHQSSNYWKRSVYFVGRRISGQEALTGVVTDLASSDNRGSKDPEVEIPTTFDQVNKLGNFLDPNTSNDYIFESVRFEQAVKKIRDIELQPIEGGGSFEPMYVRFKSKYNHVTGADLDTVYLQAIPQGFKDNSGVFNSTPSVTITQPKQTGNQSHVYGLESDEEPEQGTNLIGLFNKTAGSYPKDLSLWSGARDVFDAVKDWQSGKLYKEGHLVRFNGSTYECIVTHTSVGGNSPPNFLWVLRTFTKPGDWTASTGYSKNDLVVHNKIAYKALISHSATSGNKPPDTSTWIRVNFVPTTDYSPLTKGRAQDWINAMAGAKHAATNNQRTAVITPNCVIPDKQHPRDFVRLVETSPSSIPSSHKIGGTRIPHGYRMLAVNPSTGADSGTGDFSGNDKNGVAYAGNLIEYQDFDEDGSGDWVVIEESKNDSEIFEWDECFSWTKNPCTGLGSYVDGNGACQIGSRESTWKKGAYTLINLPLAGTVAPGS